MSVLIKCDACGEVITDTTQGIEGQKFSNPYPLEYLCHLDESEREGAGGYVTLAKGTRDHMEPVSGRIIKKDLCLRCYNMIMTAAVMKLEEIRRETGWIK